MISFSTGALYKSGTMILRCKPQPQITAKTDGKEEEKMKTIRKKDFELEGKMNKLKTNIKKTDWELLAQIEMELDR